MSLHWIDSTEGQSLESLGVDQLNAGNWEKGVATLRVALEGDPGSHEALFNLGMALGERSEMQEAVLVLEALLTRYPGHAPGLVALGVAQARMTLEDSATTSLLESLLKAVELAPGDGHARKNLGALLARTGQLAAAIEHLKHAVVILPVDRRHG
jgi:tetratricopeptide (TPR) repeat protein